VNAVRSRLISARAGSCRVGWAPLLTCAALGAILLTGLALRLIGLDWGQPFVYHPDEWVVANPAMTMIRTDSWNPHLFMYPSGLIYVERLIVAVLHFLEPSLSLSTATDAGYAGLPWRNGSNALIEQFPFFFWGRAFVAVVGALIALPTCLAARALSNPVGGIAAAAAVAVAPMAVANSRYLTTDVPTAALAIVTLWLSLRGLNGRSRWLIAAGFTAGLAASVKYNGGLVVVVPLVMLLTSRPPREWLRKPALTTAGLVVAASILGFVLLTPAAVFHPGDVWSGGIAFQFKQYSSGHAGAEGTDNAILFLRTLWSGAGFGPGLSILATIGLVVAVFEHRRGDIAVLSFVAAYFVLIALPPVRFERNLLPLLPFLAVLAGRAIGVMTDMIVLPNRPAGAPGPVRERMPRILAGLAVIVLAATPSAAGALAEGQRLSRPDTRTIALEWIEANIPHGASIGREEFTPQVPNTEYKVGFVWLLAYKPLDWYRAQGFDYLITSSYNFDTYRWRPLEGPFYASLMREPIVLDLRPDSGQRGPRIVVLRLRSDTIAGTRSAAHGSLRASSWNAGPSYSPSRPATGLQPSLDLRTRMMTSMAAR
jgi:hypothetical protein